MHAPSPASTLVRTLACWMLLSTLGVAVHGEGASESRPADPFSFDYRGPSVWSLDGRDINAASSPSLNQQASAITVPRKAAKLLLPIVPAADPTAAVPAEEFADDVSYPDAACTANRTASHTTSYVELTSVVADHSFDSLASSAVATSADGVGDTAGESESNDSGGAKLVTFREQSAEAVVETAKGVGEAMGRSRGILSEISSQLDIIRPRRFCEECGQRHRRTPVRRFMALIRSGRDEGLAKAN